MKKSLALETQKLLDKYDLRPKKRFGQNFLIDEKILAGIIDAAQLKPDELVVEIGPGLGSLTSRLAEAAGQLLAVEIDRQLVAVLEKVFSDRENIKILQGDILDLDLDQEVKQAFPQGKFPYKVVANLPYYITTPIIMGLLEGKQQIDTLVLMVQKEVGERMKAKPGTKDYGALSVAVQYYAETEICLKVPPSSFKPRPAVDSVVIKLKVREEPAVAPLDEKLFFQIVRGAFGQRRKTLVNALSNTIKKLPKEEMINILKELEIDLNIRGEQLSLEEFSAIADGIVLKNKNKENER